MKLFQIFKLKQNKLNKVILIERNEIFKLLSIKLFETNEIQNSYNNYLNKDNKDNKDNNQLKWNYLSAEKIIEEIMLKNNYYNLQNNNKENNQIKLNENNNNNNQQQQQQQQQQQINELRHKLTIQLLNDLEIDKDSDHVTYEQYEKGIRNMATKFDLRVVPISVSFLLTGLSIGIIVPCLPLLVNQIQLTSTQFGIIVSAFGVSKMLSNLPLTHFVNTVGRKPLITYGLGITAVAITGYGFSLYPNYGFPIVLLCRLCSGLGVAGITTGGQMYASDISTPLNRTRTMSPLMMSFQAGMSLGPALGGVFISSIGIAPTYYTVGGMIFAVALLNHVMLSETFNLTNNNNNNNNNKETQQINSSTSSTVHSPSLKESIKSTFRIWSSLLTTNSGVQSLTILNGVYWITLSGTQFTILPFLMMNPMLNMSVQDIGLTYTLMSVISVLVSEPIAYLADKYSKNYLIYTGCGMISVSTACLPFVTSSTELFMVLVPLSIGSTIMQNVPSASILNLCNNSEEQKSNGLSLIRTIGDLGLVTGGIMAGLISTYTSTDIAIYCQSSLLLSSVTLIAIRNYFKNIKL